jgi:hypothetical protein
MQSIMTPHEKQPRIRRTKRRHGDRAGGVMILFVLFFFGLMGLAALTIDIGFARLAQRQMQTAVDSASLEGLRWRDAQQWQEIPDEWISNQDFQSQVGISGTVSGQIPASFKEPIRRWAASHMIAAAFADEVGSAGGVAYRHGAGPVVDFAGGVGSPELAAAQLMTPGNPPLYKPTRADGAPGLELNLGNAKNGDMTAGVYATNDAYDPNDYADENDAYDRRDFQSTSGTDAFLVRMRRTPLWNVLGSVDDAPEVATAGPPLPVLFGRGSMMSRRSVTSGITVRAAAIASVGDIQLAGESRYSAGRAKSVGRSYAIPANGDHPSVKTPGVAPFALESNFLASLGSSSTGSSSSSGTATLKAATAGTATVVALQSPTGATIGYLLTTGTASGDDPNHWAADATAIGQPLSFAVANATGDFDVKALAGEATGGTACLGCFVPIYTTQSLGNQSRTIIGFAYCQWTYLAAAVPPTIAISPGPSRIASQNASGIVAFALPAGFAARSQDVSTLFQLHEGLANPLYAPTLVDHYIGPKR